MPTIRRTSEWHWSDRPAVGIPDAKLLTSACYASFAMAGIFFLHCPGSPQGGPISNRASVI